MATANQLEHNASEGCCCNLRNTDGAVEETEIHAHVSVALKGIGDDGKWQCKHGCPCATDHEIGHEEQVLVVDEWNHDEAHTANHETETIGYLAVIDLRDDHCPKDTADGLYGEEHAHPVAGILISE